MKKGTSTLAQRAWTASRILEAQVGSNPRIRVQRDDAFVLWDGIPFQDLPTGVSAASCPEWVRRTVCCAKWELEHAPEEVQVPNANPAANKLRVVLAVLSSPPDSSSVEPSHASPTAIASPVPLPAPQVNKFEPRCSGAAVSQWAARAGVEVLEVSAAPYTGPTAPKDIPASGRRSAEHGRRSGEGRRSPDDKRANAGRGRRNSHLRVGERGGTPPGGGLVERPPAVLAMMEAVAQPSRVVRVLARGEKLDP